MDPGTIAALVAIGVAAAGFAGRMAWGRRQWRAVSEHGTEVANWARSHRWRVRRSDAAFAKRFQGEPFDRKPRHGSVPACRHVVTGLHDLRPFVHLDHQADEDTGPVTCCLALALPRRLPDLTVRPQAAAENGPVPILDQLPTGSEEFDRRYEVIAHDREFALDFLDEPVLQELLRLPAGVTVRIERADILCYRREPFTPAELDRILAALAAVLGLLPERLRQP